MAETMTVAQARLAAHELALRTDPVYRASYERWLAQQALALVVPRALDGRRSANLAKRTVFSGAASRCFAW